MDPSQANDFVSPLSLPVDMGGGVSPQAEPSPPTTKAGRKRADLQAELAKIRAKKEAQASANLDKANSVNNPPSAKSEILPEMPPIDSAEPAPKKRGRKPKTATAPTVDREAIANEFGVDEEDLEEPELVAKRHELLSHYLNSPQFFPDLTERKIKNMKSIERIDREMNLGQIRIYGEYNSQITGFALNLVNNIPKKLLKLTPEKGRELDKSIAENVPLQELTKFQLSTFVLNRVPLLIRWVFLYASNVMNVVERSDL